MAHLDHNSLFFEYHFGFPSNHSTELAVTYFTDLTRKEADGGMATGEVFIDLIKALDTISHSILLSKLSRYGVHHMELQWFTNYLFLHKQIFILMVCFLNQTQLTLGFLKVVFLDLSFFSSSLMMYKLPFVVVRLSVTPTIQ